jgi:hypothetical protein
MWGIDAPKRMRSGPISRCVDDAKDHQQIIVNFIDDDVAGIRHALFACASDTAWTARIVTRQFRGRFSYAFD